MDDQTQTLLTLVLAVLAIASFRFLPRILAGVPFLDAAEVKRRIDSGQAEVVVDVRTPSEYATRGGHIPGAVNMPLADVSVRLKTLGEELGPFKTLPVVVTCATEQRASHAVRMLKKAGFTNLSVLKGGMKSWKRAGYPMETGLPEIVDEEVPESEEVLLVPESRADEVVERREEILETISEQEAEEQEAAVEILPEEVPETPEGESEPELESEPEPEPEPESERESNS